LNTISLAAFLLFWQAPAENANNAFEGFAGLCRMQRLVEQSRSAIPGLKQQFEKAIWLDKQLIDSLRRQKASENNVGELLFRHDHHLYLISLLDKAEDNEPDAYPYWLDVNSPRSKRYLVIPWPPFRLD
jgi:hypothetical protein